MQIEKPKEKNIVISQGKKRELAWKVMEMMVELQFEQEDAETFPAFLEAEIKKNNERFWKEKPFAIFKN